MGLYIDNHFLSVLFHDKKMNYSNSLYKLFFDTIWPRSELFIQFLESSDVSLKTMCAKKIFMNISFVSDCYMPSFIYLNILNDQYYELKKCQGGYVQQDHFVHSVNLYILGIYLAFNSKTLNRKLIGETGSSYNSVRQFVAKWQLFSFFHDIGYCFEKSQGVNNSFEEYSELLDKVIEIFCSRNISRVYAIKASFEKQKCIFDGRCIDGIGPWFNETGGKVARISIEKRIKSFANSICLKAISNDEELRQVLPFTTNKEHLVTAFNEFGKCEMIVLRKENKILNLFCKSQELINQLLVDDHINSSYPGYTFQYYLLGIDDVAWEKYTDDLLLIQDVAAQMPLDISIYMSINANGMQDNLYKFNEWITNTISNIRGSEEDASKENYCLCVKKSALHIINTAISDYLDNNKSLDRINEVYEGLLKTLQNNKKELKKKIQQEAQEKHTEEYAITHNFINFYFEQLNQMSEEPAIDKDKKCLRIVDDSKKSFLNLFNYDANNVFHEELYSLLSKAACKLNTTIDILKSYKPDFADYDHGIVSAALMFQIVCFSHDLREVNCSKNRFPFEINSIINKEDEASFYSEVLFSILIHNIYNKKSKQKYGVDYAHDIEKDSFSYFCSLCDTLQKWGRTKKINLSKMDIPRASYLEDEFDITVEKGQIVISCCKNYIVETQNTISLAESFLPGITSLVRIKEFGSK